MIFQIEFADELDMCWYISQIIILVFFIIYFLLTLRKWLKAELEVQKDMQKGWALFVLTIVLVQSLYLAEETADRTIHSEIFPKYIRIGGSGLIFLMILLFAFSYIFLMYPIEKYLLKREKLWITKLNKISFFLLLIPYIGALIYFNPPMDKYWTYIAWPGLVMFFFSTLFSIFGSFFFYLRLGFQGTGVVKKKGLLIGFGILMMYFALLVGLTIDTSIGGWIGIIFKPFTMIAGVLMVIAGNQIEV